MFPDVVPARPTLTAGAGGGCAAGTPAVPPSSTRTGDSSGKVCLHLLLLLTSSLQLCDGPTVPGLEDGRLLLSGGPVLCLLLLLLPQHH